MDNATADYRRGTSPADNTAARRGEHFTDPAARVVWPSVLACDKGGQHQILRALRECLAFPDERGGPQAIREARAIAALAEAAEILEDEAAARGEPIPLAEVKVSEREYERLRDEHPERNWPGSRSAARWLGGSWNDALARTGLHSVDDPDTLWRSDARGLTREQVIEALQEALADKRAANPRAWDISSAEYLAWTRRPDVRSRPGRRPRSVNPFKRLFGGFDPAKEAAFGSERPTESSQPILRARSLSTYTDDDVHSSLRAVADELGHSPRSSEYETARQRALAEDAAEGCRSRRLPGKETVKQRYGSWDLALRAAGLEEVYRQPIDPDTGRSTANPLQISYEETVAALREAYAAKGKPFTISAYESYVREHGGVPSARRLAPES
jgi:hypothetical protein